MRGTCPVRLTEGAAAPDFEHQDLDGAPVTPSQFSGRHLLLSFYRYASCPFCNLRIREVARATGDLRRAGISPVAVFHSSAESVRDHMAGDAMPFPILPDPNKRLYHLYGVERSVMGLLRGSLHLRTIARAARRGYLPIPNDLRLTSMPADVLIGPAGRVVQAYYGRDMEDHIPLDAVLSAVASPTE